MCSVFYTVCRVFLKLFFSGTNQLHFNNLNLKILKADLSTAVELFEHEGILLLVGAFADDLAGNIEVS